MPTAPYTILLVDDDENFLRITSSVLAGEGFRMKTAENVDDAVKILESLTPDLIISDITMPGRDGFDFYNHVRSLPHMQHVPFIFMTAHSDAESIMAGKEIGSDDYLTKPIDLHLLLSTIKGKLKRKQQLSDALSLQMDQIKNQLFRLISHEMKTSLTSILSATELLSDTNEPLSPSDLTSFLEMLQTSSKRLSSMVDDFLTAMKIESGELQRELDIRTSRLNPGLIIQRILHDAEQKMQLHRVTVGNSIPDDTISVYMYAPHLENILRRLIDNAIKFSNPGEVISLAMKDQDRSYTFSVKDTGCGISKENQAALYQKFQQVNREKNEQQGTGLGLYISGQLSKANNCDLWCDSEEGKGSTFYLKVPKAT